MTPRLLVTATRLKGPFRAIEPQPRPRVSLLSRLIDPQEGEEKISIHQFMAAITEYDRGAPGVTPNSIQAAFNLSAAEKQQLIDWYTDQWATGNVDRDLTHDALLLGEGKQYTFAQVMARLGLT